MGLSHHTDVRDRRAADPEALIVFTLAVGRSDPRLVDELIGWLRQNERLVSVQRLRNLAREEPDRQLVRAALAWLARFRNSRFLDAAPAPTGTAEPLFAGGGLSQWRTDPTLLEHGFVRGLGEPSFSSRRPDVRQPINLAFRLRLALGVGSRAEVVRHLGPAPGADASAQVVAEATAFAKRNVAQTLDGLVEAGLAHVRPVANERRYWLPRDAWCGLLGLEPDDLPTYQDRPQLLAALRHVLAFPSEPGLDELTPLHAGEPCARRARVDRASAPGGGCRRAGTRL